MSKMNDRLTVACEFDPSIVTPVSRIREVAGHSESYLVSLGLTKGDLLKLERHRLAIRAYTQGTRVKHWILIGDDNEV